MKAGPQTFQCACLICACRSMAAARCGFSTSADLQRMFSESVLDVRYISILLNRKGAAFQSSYEIADPAFTIKLESITGRNQ